ncbi:MAG: hypothetical protein J5J06_03505 [Phycisphaerae bacterium]|nr:hypothetical protein [Phycisphaerae bacterium]
MKRFASLAVVAVVLGLAQSAMAVMVPDVLYRLHNHPDGNLVPPPYGLRLDGLDGNTSHRFTFDFDYDDGSMQSAMYLDFDLGAGTIHIFGDVYGGQDTGSGYGAGTAGWWKVDFTYTTNVTSAADGYNLDDVRVTDEDAANSGTITAQFGSMQSYNLVDKSDGNFSFRFGDDSSAPGHRGFAGISGWGWLTHDGYKDAAGNPVHVTSSDWLFTARPAPVPGAVILGLAGFGLIGLLRRRIA